MEFKRSSGAGLGGQRKRPRLGVQSSTPSAEPSDYPHKVQMYRTPPGETISLLELESLAIQRLKLIKAVAAETDKGQRGTKEHQARLWRTVEASGLLESANSTGDDAEARAARRRDHISHFVLRLAFCKTQASRSWFLSQETELFRLRFGALHGRQCNRFLQLNQMDYEMLGMAEAGELGQEVRAAAGGWVEKLGEDEFCRVPFTEALELVRQRRCHLADGFAFVLRSDMTSLIGQRFKAALAKALAVAHKYFGFAQEEERLGPFLGRLNAHTYIGDAFTGTKAEGQVSLADLPVLARESFPLCMSQVFGELRREHHLKHGGRQQLGLFLKGLGLSLDQALDFWRSSFAKKTDPEKFNKEYAYNVRHNYGKEGSRKNYTPFSCSRICGSNAPGAGDSHGCPYVHNDAATLAQQLAALGLSDADKRKVLDHKAAKRPDLACSRTFEALHGLKEGQIPQLVAHPNQYYELSREYRTGKRTNKTIGELASQSSQA